MVPIQRVARRPAAHRPADSRNHRRVRVLVYVPASPAEAKPSYEELLEENAALRQVVAEQVRRTAEFEARLAELERRVGRNPRNSSMPPSAEGLAKPPAPNRQQRRAQQRKPGKQPGAEGKHLAQVGDPDEIVVHSPGRCQGWGAELSDGELVDVETRQVVEVPRIALYVIEHRLERRRCRCGSVGKATSPPEATAPACYGPRLRARACDLAVYQHLPYERMAELCSDVLGIEVSTGALVSMVTDAGGRLGLFLEVTEDLLRAAPAVHFDETDARVQGSVRWVHVASTALLTLLDCHKRRGTTAIDEIAVMAKMTGIAIHDGWKPHRTYDVVHGLCNAHLVRELEAIGAAAHQSWAKDMIDLLDDTRDVVEKAKAAGTDHLSRSTIRRLRRSYDPLLAAGREVNPLAVDQK